MGSDIWGVLGGMGPRASAEFLSTIYEHDTLSEQEFPVVLLLSDPTIPDRTESLLNGKEQILLERLSSGLNQLVGAGATKLVVCCMTIHPLIPSLPAALQAKIISLVDAIFAGVLQTTEKHLLLCTQGTMMSGLFQKHELWPIARDQIVLPKAEDLRSIHSVIYEIKRNKLNGGHVEFLQSLLSKYRVRSYIAGCTEIHLLAKEQERITRLERQSFCIDPLTIIASAMREPRGKLQFQGTT